MCFTLIPQLEEFKEDEPEHWLRVILLFILLFSFALGAKLVGFYQYTLAAVKLIDAAYLDFYVIYVAGAVIKLDGINVKHMRSQPKLNGSVLLYVLL